MCDQHKSLTAQTPYENQIEQFKNEVNLAEQIDHNLMTDPNRTYAVLEGIIKKA